MALSYVSCDKAIGETMALSRLPRDLRLLAADSCHFADRCPQVMEVCRKQAPPLYQTDARRVVKEENKVA